jgi:hypothetical protein
MFRKIALEKKSYVAGLLVFLVTFSFQNCGQDMSAVKNVNESSLVPQGSAGSAQSLEPCIAGGCPQDANYIQLSIENHDPVSFLTDLSNSVLEPRIDVSGYCNMGGYLYSRIYYVVSDDAGNLAIPQTLSTGACSDVGRYAFPISIMSLAGNKNYHITVIMKVLDSTGAEYENPLKINRKQIGLSPRTGI